ncbi:SUMF1/EgtB/PvdO family nonheme iron enzyme [Kovacikia minuta]|uniref:SUMF1/EgtB/PvdO family nonheme iron enzyme n=1 Tax=Kovacikia minuta TaxID=2931930 RepID=UPI0036F4376E
MKRSPWFWNCTGGRGQGAGGRDLEASRINSKFKIQNSKFKTSSPSPSLPTPHSPLPTPLIQIPAGYFNSGNDSIDALDNERPVHQIYLDTYWIDRDPVTCAQYRQFIAAGGYQDACWWSPEGWQWLQSAQITHPLYWKDEPEWEQHPVCGVSWYEADAYARFVGKRLPTEAEWEKAACWSPLTNHHQTYPWGEAELVAHLCNHDRIIKQTTPVGAYPEGKSPYGCNDLLGNVWEWTASWFEGYNGFTAYPYRGYSQVYFDGKHRVLKGGSWATFPWALRSTFRNWYYPHVREILAGFRCAADRG